MEGFNDTRYPVYYELLKGQTINRNNYYNELHKLNEVLILANKKNNSILSK